MSTLTNISQYTSERERLNKGLTDAFESLKLRLDRWGEAAKIFNLSWRSAERVNDPASYPEGWVVYVGNTPFNVEEARALALWIFNSVGHGESS